MALAIAGAGASHAQKTQQRNAKPQTTSADQLLSLGDYYSRNNDMTDQADSYYKRVIVTSPGSPQAGTAQYNRGSYWHKKYNLLREKQQGSSRDALKALDEAEGQYYDFIDKYAVPTTSIGLLADAEFNLALVYLQKNKISDAMGWLNIIIYRDAKRDGQIYIYRVIWSSNAGDVVDRNVDSLQLATFTASLIGKGLSVDQVISQVKQWCRKQ